MLPIVMPTSRYMSPVFPYWGTGSVIHEQVVEVASFISCRRFTRTEMSCISDP